MGYSFTEALKLVFSKQRIFDYKSRSCRSEFWWFVLFVIIINIPLAIILSILASIPLIGQILFYIASLAYSLFSLLLLVMSYIIAIRRLHDKNLTGWLVLLEFIPFGPLVLIVLWCLKGTDGPNSYGDDPLLNKIYVNDEDNYFTQFKNNFFKDKANTNNGHEQNNRSYFNANNFTHRKDEDKSRTESQFKFNPNDKEINKKD